MTLTDYAKYLLNVCGKRFTHLYQRHYLESTPALPSLSALLTYLRTQTASIFTQIKARGAVHPLSGLPTTETLATLPTALATLSTRKVDTGTSVDIEDGVSLAELTCSTKRNLITEYYDTEDSGWTMSYNLRLPSLTKLTLGCRYIVNPNEGQGASWVPTTINQFSFPNLLSYGITYEYRPLFIYNNPNVTELTFPKLQAMCSGFSYDGGAEGAFISKCPALNKVYCPELIQTGQGLAGHGDFASGYGCFVHTCDSIEKIILPKWGGYRNWRIVRNSPSLRKFVMGAVTYAVPYLYNNVGGNAYPFESCSRLIHYEIGDGTNINFLISCWSPTKALMSDPTAEGYENLVTQSMVDDLNATLEEGQTQYTLTDFPNNLKLFIENFYIFFAKRLQSQTTAGAKTLTLSSAVATALQNNTAKDGTNVYTYITNIKKWTIATA